MLRKILPALCIILLSAPAVGAEIDGMWLRGDGNARVRIARCGGKVCATNVWIRNPKSQGEAVGDQLVMSLSQQPDGNLAGEAHDVRCNLNMSVNITVSPGQLRQRAALLAVYSAKQKPGRQLDEISPTVAPRATLAIAMKAARIDGRCIFLPSNVRF